MRFMLLLILFFSYSTHSWSQEKNGMSLSLNAAMNRIDFFSGVRFGKRLGLAETGLAFEVGINRTFFQSRIFPRITVGSNFYLLHKEKFDLGPAVSYSYSFLEVNKSAGSIHQWNEVYGGYALSVGGNWRFCHSVMTGWMNERYRSQISKKKEGVNTLGFYFNLGISYAW